MKRLIKFSLLILISLVENAERNFESQFVDQSFPDVCVDIEGTLLASDGTFHSEIIALAKEKANGGPITIRATRQSAATSMGFAPPQRAWCWTNPQATGSLRFASGWGSP